MAVVAAVAVAVVLTPGLAIHEIIGTVVTAPGPALIYYRALLTVVVEALTTSAAIGNRR